MKGEVAADNADTADPLDLETWKADEVVAKRAMKAKNLIEIILEFVYVRELSWCNCQNTRWKEIDNDISGLVNERNDENCTE